jgi:competence protein ComEA
MAGWAAVAVLAAAGLTALGVTLASRSGGGQDSTLASLRLNLNTAGTDELALLPGVGPYGAARVVRERARRGAFRSLAELDEPGLLGPGASGRLKAFLLPVTGVPGAAPEPRP